MLLVGVAIGRTDRQIIVPLLVLNCRSAWPIDSRVRNQRFESRSSLSGRNLVHRTLVLGLVCMSGCLRVAFVRTRINPPRVLTLICDTVD